MVFGVPLSKGRTDDGFFSVVTFVIDSVALPPKGAVTRTSPAIVKMFFPVVRVSSRFSV